MYIPQLNKMEQVSRSPRPKSLDEMVNDYGSEATRKSGRAIRFLAFVAVILIPLGLLLQG